MPAQTTRLMLNINAGPETDEEELAELTRQLREELLELDVEAVGLVRAGEAPERAKAGDPVTWGALLVALVASGGVLTTLINTLHWLMTIAGWSQLRLPGVWRHSLRRSVQ